MRSNKRINTIQPCKDWELAHERFVRNQEWRIKKYKISDKASRYMKENFDNIENKSLRDEVDSRREGNPFEDEALTLSVTLAEKRNIKLNEIQSQRIEIARRRQGQFVASGHAFDNEHFLKSHVLPFVPKNLDLSAAFIKDMRQVHENFNVKEFRQFNNKKSAILPISPRPDYDDVKFLTKKTNIHNPKFRQKFQKKSELNYDITNNDYKNLVSDDNKEHQREILKLFNTKKKKMPKIKPRKITSKNGTTQELLIGVDHLMPRKEICKVQLSYPQINKCINILNSVN